MCRISRAVHVYVLSRDCESSGVPRAEVGGDDYDGYMTRFTELTPIG